MKKLVLLLAISALVATGCAPGLTQADKDLLNQAIAAGKKADDAVFQAAQQADRAEKAANRAEDSRAAAEQSARDAETSAAKAEKIFMRSTKK